MLVVAGGQAAPVLQDVEGALDDNVALFVVLGVEVQQTSAGGAWTLRRAIASDFSGITTLISRACSIVLVFAPA